MRKLLTTALCIKRREIRGYNIIPSSSHEKEQSETSVKATTTTTNTSKPVASKHAKPNVTNNASNNNRSASTGKKQNDTKKGTWILGSSFLHKIRTRGLQKNVHVRTMNGARVSTIRRRIESADLREVGNIIIQVGGNDISELKQEQRTIEAIKNDYVEIILDVRARSTAEVYISELLPRADINHE